MPPLDAAAAADAVRKIRSLELALKQERAGRTAAEQRTLALESALRRSYQMALTPPRPRDEE